MIGSLYEAIQDLGLKHQLVLDVGCCDEIITIVHQDFIEIFIGLDMYLKCLKKYVFEYTRIDMVTLFSKSSFRQYEVKPIRLVSLSKLEIAPVPRFISRYCDQLMAILKK